MPNSLRFSLPGNKESIFTVRLAIVGYAKSAGFSEEAIDDIGISITEACRVVCCHGEERMACRFLVVCSMKEDTIMLKLSSNNAEFIVDKEECDMCGYRKGDCELSMFILSSLMDSVDFDEDGEGSKILVMQKTKKTQENTNS